MSACRRRRSDRGGRPAAYTRLRSVPVSTLEITPRPLRGAPCLALAGELDIADVPRLEHALDAAIAETTGAFLLDLCELEFLDSSGIRVLLRARALLGRENRVLVLVCPAGPVRRALELTGVVDLFAIYASRADAARALVPAEPNGAPT
jgi:anti-sigma B factor antagonist